MASKDSSIPGCKAKSFAANFVEHRLPEHVPALVSLGAQPDPDSQQSLSNNQSILQTVSSYPRPEVSDTRVMVFWQSIFENAMEQFQSKTKEPSGRAQSPYSIRNASDWDHVYSLLLSARERFQESGGHLGILRKVRRKAADHIGPVANMAKTAIALTPDNVYSTPILGAVDVVLDAIRSAATVRNQVLGAFDGLIDMFSDVELFLGTFPQDTRIRNVSVALVVSTLKATESAIGYFTSNEILRGGKALLLRKDYQKPLLDSLGEIESQSKKLLEEALKSHMYDFRVYSQETQRLHFDLRQGQVQIKEAFFKLFYEYEVNRQREIEAARQEIFYLRTENVELRSQLPVSLSPQRSVTPVPLLMGWTIGPEMLYRMIGPRDMDVTDLTFVEDTKYELPWTERAKAEQIVSMTPFRSWITSASSTKLMVYSDEFHTIANVSALTTFCATMITALRSQPGQFVPVAWFCGQHHDRTEVQSHAYLGPQAMLKSIIDQLLRQGIIDMHALCQYIDIASLQNGNVDVCGLLRLLDAFLLQMADTHTVFFIIDGVVLFETPELLDDTVTILGRLVSFTEDARIRATVKVLFTSVPGASVISIEETECVDSLSLAELVPSDERLVEELGA